MTLLEFFDRLAIETRASDITETFGGHMNYSRRDWIIERLSHLKTQCQTNPELWAYQRSTNQANWDAIVPYLMNAGILSRYMQNIPLRNLLREFLCRPQVV